MKNLKASMPIEFLTGKPFEFWGWVCGALLARAHARTGDIAKIAGYIGKSNVFATALADFAEAYGDQTERDLRGSRRSRADGVHRGDPRRRIISRCPRSRMSGANPARRKPRPPVSDNLQQSEATHC